MSETYKSGGLNFTSILTLIFVLCKLTHFISWSWWLVFAPVLISTGLTIFILALIAIIATVAVVLK